MKAQSALEAMLVVAGFLLVMSILSGLYLRFSASETSLSTSSRLKIDIHRVANAVNDVYVLGPDNAIRLELSSPSTLSSTGLLLLLSSGQQTVNATVFAPVEIRSTGRNLLIENLGGKIVVTPLSAGE